MDLSRLFFALASFLFPMLSSASAEDVEPVSIAVLLSPAGEFEVSAAEVIGRLTKNGERLLAKEISVPIDKMITGIELRDQHLREKLGWPNEKNVVARDIEIARDSGKGILTVNKVSKPFTFKVTAQSPKDVTAKFPLLLSDYGIKGVRYLNVGVEDELVVTVTVPYGK